MIEGQIVLTGYAFAIPHAFTPFCNTMPILTQCVSIRTAVTVIPIVLLATQIHALSIFEQELGVTLGAQKSSESQALIKSRQTFRILCHLVFIPTDKAHSFFLEQTAPL